MPCRLYAAPRGHFPADRLPVGGWKHARGEGKHFRVLVADVLRIKCIERHHQLRQQGSVLSGKVPFLQPTQAEEVYLRVALRGVLVILFEGSDEREDC